MNPSHVPQWPTTWVINLASRPDKWKVVHRHLTTRGLPHIRWNGTVPSVEEIRADTILAQTSARSCCGVGVVGCRLSHLDLVAHAQKRGYSVILILEDDVYFEKERDYPRELAQILATLDRLDPQWEMLYLGANHRQRGVEVSPGLKRCFQAYTTGSYLLHSRAFERIISESQKYIGEIDTFYVDCLQSRGHSYALSPGWCSQLPGKSDISGNYADYLFNEC